MTNPEKGQPPVTPETIFERRQLPEVLREQFMGFCGALDRYLAERGETPIGRTDIPDDTPDEEKSRLQHLNFSYHQLIQEGGLFALTGRAYGNRYFAVLGAMNEAVKTHPRIQELPTTTLSRKARERIYDDIREREEQLREMRQKHPPRPGE